MYRLLALDIDDTILAADGSLPEANRLAMERLHRRGVVVVLSSGRATVSMREVALQILPAADDEYLISFNGARVVTVLSDTVLLERLVTPDAIGDVVRYAREHDLLVQGYGEDDFISERDDPRCAGYAASVSMKHRLVQDLMEAMPQGSAKLLIIHDPAEIRRHQDALNHLARGRFETTISKPSYIEIVATGVSKGSALHHLASHLRIPIEETIAVGDSMNDMEMIRAAGMGVAVANARDELKAEATVVLDRTAADGAIAEVEERFFPKY